ncbi:MAG: choloylglycine hydrolase [Clostridia bacterium]|nr:choloylglycine hydrolase [Clostridia bacterium]
MCTSISFKTKAHYFGRNLDMECSFDEKVIIVGRNFPFGFRHLEPMFSHFAIMGIGIVEENFPLYYEAVNEKGLAVSGLRFTSSVYNDINVDKENLCVFELIPYVLGKCSNVNEAKELLTDINIVNTEFSEGLGTAQLHWMISDKDSSITVECVQEGLKIYYNPAKVLTNNPEFPMQVFNLNNYMSLTADEPVSKFSDEFEFNAYSRGMGALGLPGDMSSVSRFVKATFVLHNSVCGKSEDESISQFFHILSSVSQQKGCVKVGDLYEKTVYSSCYNTDDGILYYTTYNNSQISAVTLHKENLDRSDLIIYNLNKEQNICFQN